MPESDNTPIAAPAPVSRRAAPLGHHAAGGAAWALLQTGASKIFGLTTQFVIAEVMDKHAIGAAFQALAILSFPVALQRFGMTELLIQRQKRFDKFATAAFSISVLSGFVVAFIGVICAFVLGIYQSMHHIPGSPEDPWLVSKLVIVCVIGNVFDGFIAVPQARLRTELRFARLNLISLNFNLVVNGLTILFIMAGFGAMSIILPRSLGKGFELIVTWRSAHVKLKRTLDLKRWKYLLRNGSILTMFLFSAIMIQNADNVAVGLFQGDIALSIYGFAFNLSTQSVQLFAISITTTLMSVFSKISGEPARQVDAYMRSAGALNLLVTPLCILQAAIARPLLHLFFGTKWDAAIPALQILSIGMVFSSMGGGIAALFQAQGRFYTQFVLQFCMGLCFSALVFSVAYGGDVVAVSLAVCIFYAFFYPLGAYVAARPARVGILRIVGIFFRPILLSIFACGLPLAAIYAGNFFPDAVPQALVRFSPLSYRLLNFLECAVISASSASIYILLLRKLRWENSETIMHYFRTYAGRLQNVPCAGAVLRYFQLIEPKL